MTHNEKLIATMLFKVRVFGAEGQAYEDLFTSVMCQAIPNFRQVKPQGRLGDKKMMVLILQQDLTIRSMHLKI